jgi:hypothetical protein
MLMQTNGPENLQLCSQSFTKHFVNDQVKELLTELTVVPNSKANPKYGAKNF